MDKKHLKNLFDVNYLPKIDLSLTDIPTAAQEMAGKMSISGVQPKLSMKLDKKNGALEVAGEGGEYILKPQLQTFNNIPQNENLCMDIAASLGIQVPPHALVSLKDNSLAYIVKRFDRIKKEKLHQENFFQILGEKDKYKGSMEKIGKKLKEISEIPGFDAQLFFERILYFFIIGNGDAHLKNFSIIYDKENFIRLSPAYDIVSSKLVIPHEEDSALTINGKKNNLARKDFDELVNALKINSKASYKNILGSIKTIDRLIKNSLLTDEEKKSLSSIVKERALRLSKQTS